MNDHLRFRLLAAARVDEALDPGDAVDLELHLGNCAACSSLAAGVRQDHQALGMLSPVATAPWVRESILRAARGRRGPTRWALMAAAILLIALAIGAGLAAGALLREYRSLIPVDPFELSSTWTPVAVAVPDDGSRMRAIVSNDRGFLAGGASAEGATIWLSSDGIAWDEQTALPEGAGAEIAVMVVLDGRVLAAGQAPDGPVVWTNGPDLRYERQVLPGAEAGGGVNDIIASADGLLAVGWRSDGGTRSAAAWRSTDGVVWTMASVGAAPALRTVATLPDGGYVATGGGGPESVPLFSVDGSVWELDKQSFDVVTSLPGEAVTFVRFGDYVYAIGYSETGSLATWRSADGRAWSEFDMPALPDVDIRRARVVEERLLIVGSMGSEPLALSLTADGAVKRQPIDSTEGSGASASFYDAAGSAGTMVAVGVSGVDAAVWASN